MSARLPAKWDVPSLGPSVTVFWRSRGATAWTAGSGYPSLLDATREAERLASVDDTIELMVGSIQPLLVLTERATEVAGG